MKVNLLSFAEKKIFVNQNELDETIDTGTKGFLKFLTTTDFVVIIVAANWTGYPVFKKYFLLNVSKQINKF